MANIVDGLDCIRKYVIFGGSATPRHALPSMHVSGGYLTACGSTFDIDEMLEVERVIALPPGESHKRWGNKVIDFLWICKTDEVNSGYTRLMRTSNGQYYSRHDMMGSDVSRGPAYTFPFPSQNAGKSSEDDWFPFVLTDPFNTRTLPLGIFNHELTGYDIVPYIHCPVWPPEAAEWKVRPRKYGWPQRSLISKCIKQGCGFVSKAHPNSVNPDIEFRYSFSEAEDILVADWKPSQVNIYILLKKIKTEINKRFNEDEVILCSYHLKTFMLWAVENKPPEFWSYTCLASLMRQLVFELIQWFVDRRCPHYFIPSFNILDHIKASANLEELINSIYCTSQQIVFDFTDLFRIIGISFRNSTIQETLSSALERQRLSENQHVLSKAELFELRDLYVALCAQVDLIRMSSTMSSEVFETGKRIVGQQFKKSLELDERLVDLHISNSGDLNFQRSEIELVRLFIRQLRTLRWKCTTLKELMEKNSAVIEDKSSTLTLMDEGRTDCRQVASGNESLDDKQPCTLTNLANLARNLLYPEMTQRCNPDLMKTFFRRFSRTLSATYLANFNYTVSHDYFNAIELCEEVINFILAVEDDTKFLCSLVHCSSEMAPLFDSNIQSMLGLVLLYDSIHQQATRSEPTQEHVYMYISTAAFAYYIKICCYQELATSFGDEESKQALDHSITQFIDSMRNPFGLTIQSMGASDWLLRCFLYFRLTEKRASE